MSARWLLILITATVLCGMLRFLMHSSMVNPFAISFDTQITRPTLCENSVGLSLQSLAYNTRTSVRLFTLTFLWRALPPYTVPITLPLGARISHTDGLGHSEVLRVSSSLHTNCSADDFRLCFLKCRLSSIRKRIMSFFN